MPLLRLDDISLHYGTLNLLDGVNLNITRGQKVGLLGRNGAGKTTLLKVLAGDVLPDGGERWLRPGVRIAWLQQTLPSANQQTVYDVVASGLAEAGVLLAEYHHLLQAGDSIDMTALSRVQQKLEDCDGWTLQQRVETTISQLQLPSETKMEELSGGWRRRVALAQALVSEPEILLLDEPTNHLDIPAIAWLEDQLRAYQGALILITHDRRFLQNVANWMAELDRGHLTLWEGSYSGFLRHREQQLLAEEKANQLFDKRLAQEEVWIRQGIKARRTRNEGRVTALKQMREERRQRRDKMGTADFIVEDASRSGKIVAELTHIHHAFDEQTIISDYSTVIRRGDRIGIIGTNGAGKTTLVKIILGELVPSQGEVKLGTKLEVAYSDQLRGHLDPDKTLMDNVCGGQEFIDIGGRRRHAISYLGDFLFAPDRVRMPVKALSGGEQNRAVLAKLFSKPANLLVLDEPTNDLDMETLELLEEILLGFEGTVLLVSHDREFMDNVVTSLIVMDGKGGVTEHIGGYSGWEERGGSLTDQGIKHASNSVASKPDQTKPESESKKTTVKKRLSYKDKRELETLPAVIEGLENEISRLEAKMADPDFYTRDHEEVQSASTDFAAATKKLEEAFSRWQELENPD